MGSLYLFTLLKKEGIRDNTVLKLKVKQSRNGPGVTQRFPGDLGSQIS
jgi:hypothetical protein